MTEYLLTPGSWSELSAIRAINHHPIRTLPVRVTMILCHMIGCYCKSRGYISTNQVTWNLSMDFEGKIPSANVNTDLRLLENQTSFCFDVADDDICTDDDCNDVWKRRRLQIRRNLRNRSRNSHKVVWRHGRRRRRCRRRRQCSCCCLFLDLCQHKWVTHQFFLRKLSYYDGFTRWHTKIMNVLF